MHTTPAACKLVGTKLTRAQTMVAGAHAGVTSLALSLSSSSWHALQHAAGHRRDPVRAAAAHRLTPHPHRAHCHHLPGHQPWAPHHFPNFFSSRRCFYVVLCSARRRQPVCYRRAFRRTTRSSRCSSFFDIMSSLDLSNGLSIVHAASSVASSSISDRSPIDSTFLPHPPTPPHSSTRRLRQTFPALHTHTPTSTSHSPSLSPSVTVAGEPSPMRALVIQPQDIHRDGVS